MNASKALTLAACTLQIGAVAAKEPSEPKPNFVFFLTEDLSPHYLALFNNGVGCPTPNVEHLASEGIRYTNAYSNAPVSSAARTTLMTGCYAPSFAGGMHRRLVAMPMPEGLQMFPTYLRELGYYTSNFAKTDYNVPTDPYAWDKINARTLDDWRERNDPQQPFFFMRSNVVTHESKLLFDEHTYRTVRTKTHPDSVHLHSYLPDTPLMRYTYATFYDRIQESDAELGRLVELLREEGELENTFIFYMGDNGGTLPGTKGYTDDKGLHVPMVVYIPQNFRHLIDQPIGSVQDKLVSFMDLAPTLIHLAGGKVPHQMDGLPILGKGAIEGHKSVYGYGDRFGELYAFNRSLRKGRYRYARNFQPYHTQSLNSNYRYSQLAFQEWRELFRAGRLNAVQSTFFQPFGAEELYDLVSDPEELNNLAKDAAFAPIMKEMRSDLFGYMVEQHDLGLLPECIILEEGADNPDNYGTLHKREIRSYLEVANLQLLKYVDARPQLLRALASPNSVECWWALTTIASFGKEARELKGSVRALLDHERSFVRARAVVALASLGDRVPNRGVYPILKSCLNGAETLLVLNDFTHMVECGWIAPFVLSSADVPQRCDGVDSRISYLNRCADRF